MSKPLPLVMGPRTMKFVVYGTPIPQGSSKIVPVRGRLVITGANRKTGPWRHQVAGAVAAQNAIPFAKDAPVALTLDFYLARPPSAPRKRTRPMVRPDLDKLVRSIFDALAGIVYHNDAQVTDLVCHKRYSDVERVEILISEAR